MPTEHQHEFLGEKLARCTKEDPRWEQLAERLLGIGGQLVVACFEEDMTHIIARAREWKPAVRVKAPGRPCNCHENSCDLAESDPSWSVVTGWALSDDELWRQHSWCVRGGEDGQPLELAETTTPRISYYGFKLTKVETESFAFNQ